MFKPTKAHEKEITKGQHKIRMGGRVPENAVNLAYSYVTPLSPDENVQIADTSGFILENVASETITDLELWPNETYLLTTNTGKSDIYSQTFLITNIFKDNVPLYFSHRLKHLHHDALGPDIYERYQGKSIIVVDKHGEKIGAGDKKIHILLKPTMAPNLYNVDIYTSFQVMPGEEFRVIYNAVDYDEHGNQYVMTGFSERLNALAAFSPRSDIELVTKPEFHDEPIYYQAQSSDFGYSQIYASRRLQQDTRNPVRFQYQISAFHPSNPSVIYRSPWIGGSVLNAESLTPIDTDYRNGFRLMSEESAEELMVKYFANKPVVADFQSGAMEYYVSTDAPNVDVDVKSDGKEPVVANTNQDTGSLNLPLDYRLRLNEPIVEFFLQIWLRNKTNDNLTEAVFAGPYRLRKSNGQVDLKNINYAEWLYPADYDADNYEVFVRTEFSTTPVTLSLWDKTSGTRYGLGDEPIPATVFNFHTDIVIAGEVKELVMTLAPRYMVRPTDNAQVRVLRPIAKGSKDNWYLRVKNGRFYRSYIDENNLPQGYGYFLPEYYAQAFDDVYGMPYRKIEDERPQVVDTNQIKLMYTPLFIHVDKLTNLPDNITVTVNGTIMNVKAWNASEGIVELEGAIRESDSIQVTYYYQELCYEYRGYFDEERNRFWYLDLNPGKGHFSTQYDKDADEIKDLQSFGLINKTIYMYMKPAGNMTNIAQVLAETVSLDMFGKYTLKHQALSIFTPRVYKRYANTDVKHVSEALAGETSWEIVEEGYLYQNIKINNPETLVDDHYAIDYSHTSDKYRFINGTFERTVLFHTFEEINEPNTILLGKIQVRPNSSRDGVAMTDTRSRGGGILDTIGQALIDEILPDASSYWDIGYWDGNPYPENAVIVIKLPRHILKDYGGKSTKEEVEASVEKHLAYGVFYIIEYLEEPNSLIEVPTDLVVEVVDMPDPNPEPLPKPTFILITEG